MTVVYLDSFLLINFVMNFLLLLACAKFAGERLRRWRFALAALFGALYAAASFFPGLAFSLHPLYKISVALLMLLISFGKSRNLLRISLIFLAIACAFCGGILAIEWLKGTDYMKDGIVYSALDVKGLIMSAVFCYGLLCLVFRRAAVHQLEPGELQKVRLVLAGRALELSALRDSGNTLQDPLSGCSVPVAEGARLLPLLPAELDLRQEELARPIEALQRLSGRPEARRLRLLPYRAVGVDCGLLLTLRLDAIFVGDERLEQQSVALSPTPVSDGGAYGILLAFGSRLEKGEEQRL